MKNRISLIILAMITIVLVVVTTKTISPFVALQQMENQPESTIEIDPETVIEPLMETQSIKSRFIVDYPCVKIEVVSINGQSIIDVYNAECENESDFSKSEL